MVTEFQFLAAAAFLIWCLASSITGLFDSDRLDDARLVWREHGPSGWGAWREVHYGLTAADHRVLTHPEEEADPSARESLFAAVYQQTRQPDADAVQYAVVRMSPDRIHATAVFMSASRHLEPVN
jgi:hypothetical protein